MYVDAESFTTTTGQYCQSAVL